MRQVCAERAQCFQRARRIRLSLTAARAIVRRRKYNGVLTSFQRSIYHTLPDWPRI
jgi:hypothetical protein